MGTIPHRERRCHGDETLRRVGTGGTCAGSPLDALREAGRVTETRTVELGSLPAASGLSSRELLDDLRGEG